MSDYLFHRTGGMIGSLFQLIRGAAVLAIEDGSEAVTEELLELVRCDTGGVAGPDDARGYGAGARGRPTGE